MKINLERAIEVAKKQQEIGACSENGQALVLIYEALQAVQKIVADQDDQIIRLSDNLFIVREAYDSLTEQMEEELDYKDNKIDSLRCTINDLEDELQDYMGNEYD